MSHALIVSNGVINDYSFYIPKLSQFDYIICADGAIKHLINMDICPNLWIGDFDSCSFSDVISDKSYLKDVETLKLNPVKDATDTEVACDIAIQKGYKDITIWGALGGRCDHMLSNIHLLEKIIDKGASATIEDEKNTLTLCKDYIEITKSRKYLSVIPLDKSIYISKTYGLVYPMENYELFRLVSKGVSNEIIDKKAQIYIKSGTALIVQSDD